MADEAVFEEIRAEWKASLEKAKALNDWSLIHIVGPDKWRRASAHKDWAQDQRWNKGSSS